MNPDSKHPFETAATEDQGEALPENPVIIDDTRPAKTQLEANWESHTAGIKARIAMADKPDTDVRALMSAMLKGKKVGEEYVQCLDATMLLLAQEVSTIIEKEEWKWLAGSGYQLAVMPWLALFPDEAFDIFDRDDVDFARKAIRSVTKKLSSAELKEFNVWVNTRLEELRGEEEDESDTDDASKKKPQGPRSQKPKARK